MDKAPTPDPTVTDLITITIKTIDSKNYQFQVESDIQIKALKEKIAPTLGIDVESQRMIFCGRVLADDKTLQFYKIDNGKVIHVVKRTTPPVRNDTPNNNENTQQNDRNNPSRFRSFRNDDGSSVLMGTFSVDPPANIINQVMRHLFFNRSNSSGQSDGSSDSNSQSNTASNESLIRARFNQIRQLHSYIETNFNILQNPAYLPRSQHVINAFPENQPITVRDYQECFNDTLNFFDRLRPYLDETLNSLNSNNNNNNNDNNDTTSSSIADSAQNSSIIMRVAHHLSHVLHALTDLSIDRSNPNSPTIKLNTLNNNSPNPISALLQTAINGGDYLGNTTTTNINNNASATGANQTNTGGATGNTDNANISFTVETNTNRTQAPNPVSNTSTATTTATTSASTSTTSSSSSPADILSSITNNANNPLPRALGSGTFPGGVLVTQSPILLMEVDATIDGHRTSLGTRTMPNFSLSDFNITFNNMISNAANVTLNSMNLNNMGSSSSASQSTSNSNSHSTTTSSSNNNTNTSDSDANNQSSRQTENTGQQTRPTVATNAGENNATGSNSTINPLQAFSMRFDPFLTCNSTYTLPEIRSATNLGHLDNLDNSIPDALRQMINEMSDPEHDGDNGSPNDFDMFTELANLLNLDSPSSNRPEIDDGYQAFFDFIRFLSQNAQHLSPALSLDVEGSSGTVRIGDYMRRFNLFHSDEDNFMSRMMQLLFENLSFEDFYQIINFNFNNFGRLRQPLQEFIRSNLLSNDQEYSIENMSIAIENILSDNENILINITQNLKPANGVNVVKSLRVFLKETLVKFLDSIMRSSNDDDFENDVVTAVIYLITCYIHFCNACFASPEESRIRLIQNYLDQYPEMVESRFRALIVALIKGRIDAISQNLSDEHRKEVNERIVFERSASSDNNQQQPMDSLPDHEEPSNSYDSEEVEFADACSEIPSTSSVSVSKNSNNDDNRRNADSIKLPAEAADWENVVPNDWVPIVKEDLEKQKNIDDKHPPPFSDAYLNGMSKKRRYDQSK